MFEEEFNRNNRNNNNQNNNNNNDNNSNNNNDNNDNNNNSNNNNDNNNINYDNVIKSCRYLILEIPKEYCAVCRCRLYWSTAQSDRHKKKGDRRLQRNITYQMIRQIYIKTNQKIIIPKRSSLCHYHSYDMITPQLFIKDLTLKNDYIDDKKEYYNNKTWSSSSSWPKTFHFIMARYYMYKNKKIKKKYKKEIKLLKKLLKKKKSNKYLKTANKFSWTNCETIKQNGEPKVCYDILIERINNFDIDVQSTDIIQHNKIPIKYKKKSKPFIKNLKKRRSQRLIEKHSKSNNDNNMEIDIDNDNDNKLL